MVIPFFLMSPANRYHAELLIFTQIYSIGHFWSPFHTIIEGIFCIFFITADTPISYKHSVSISCKTPHFHVVSSFVPLYITIPRQRLWVLRGEKLSFLSFFVVACMGGESHFGPDKEREMQLHNEQRSHSIPHTICPYQYFCYLCKLENYKPNIV